MTATFIVTALIGVVIGIISGMLGVGGGMMMVPLFRLAYGMSAVVSTATSLFTIIILASVGFVLMPGINLMNQMLLAQVINGILLPVLLIFMLLLVNDRRLMGTHTSGRIYNLLSWFMVIVVIGLTAVLLVMPLFGMG